MNEERKKFNWQLLVILILGVLLISVTIFAVNKETTKISNKEPEKVYVGSDDEEVLDNFSEEDAVQAMTDLLNSVDEDIDGEDRTIEERMEVLDDNEADMKDVVSEDTINRLYLADNFKDEQFNRQFTASALLTYRQLIQEVTEDDKVKPLIDVYDEVIYLDSELKTAHIPIDVFIGDNKGIAFEMQYIDGEWKFNPYTSMMSLVMIVNYEEQIGRMAQEEE